ncbi:uncharacterized protein E0L32_007032 [Thyridium curvatum]|uniref:F-box domain-containing protein n=1 Tax=Thyridium curvatum TaxID=1093900 RepID=A0A507ANK6_9PEZI|nr:uncharacterized protein E0L32_007032 [Thyridium curvatum]TPX12385.1 hypothetical protein E0L32_007032 [Thyridium curvatum]
MVQTLPRRVFPVSDWAPSQEAMYPESSSTQPATAHTFTTHEPDSPTTVVPNALRYRSMSMTLPWRQRPKSALFGGHDNDHHAVDAFADRFPPHDMRRARSRTHGDVFEEHDEDHTGDHGEASDHPTAASKGKKAIKGALRRASISLKGIIIPSRRTSVATSNGEEHHHIRSMLRSAHEHHASSHTLSPFDSAAGPSHSARPTTSHSTWRRLRQAASFRHSRVLYDGFPGLETIESPRESTFNLQPQVPVPGTNNGPPIIPPNTGGAARAAAAAFQSDMQRKWLHPEEYPTDRESGIGIAVTTSDSPAEGLIADDDEQPDMGVDVDDRAVVEGCCGVDVPGITRIDFVSRLPTELAIHILANLDAAGLATAARVARRWRWVVRNQHIWRESFLREKTTTYATSAPVRPGAGQGIPPTRPGNDWRQIYKTKEELDRRWREGKATPVYLNGHSDSIYCLQFDEYVSTFSHFYQQRSPPLLTKPPPSCRSKIITGSRDKTIRIWDMHTLACKLVIGPPEVIHDPALLYDEDGRPTHYATPDAATTNTETTAAVRGPSSTPAAVTFETHHKASILCLQYDDRILVTGSSDATCIVYSIASGYRPVRRLQHHTAAVLDLCFDDRHIVTCSKDISICVWDRETGSLLKQLRGHSGPVNAVQMRGSTIVSCSGDFRVKLWNIDTGKAIREFQGHTKGLACSQFSEDGRYVASAGNDRVIRVWDANTGECVREMRAHENLVRSLHVDSVSGRLVSGSYDTDIKVFDMETGRQLLDFPRWHASWVLSAKSDYRRIISTGQDPKILVMDFGAGVEGIEMLESCGGRGGGAAGAGAGVVPVGDGEGRI